MKKLFEIVPGITIPENISSALGWTLIHSLWQGVGILVVFSVLRYIFKTSHSRYWQGIGALSLQLVSAVVTFFMVYEPASALNPSGNTQTFSGFLVQTYQGSQLLAPVKLSFIQQAEAFLRNNLDSFVLFWFIGATLLLMRLSVGFVYVQQLKVQQISPIGDDIQLLMDNLLKKINMAAPIKLLESAKATVPMTIGWLKPIVLLPIGMATGLTMKQLEAVLAHELAHIKRYDYLINIFQSFVEILFFYHPATWWISGKVRDERENCCDDFAVDICGDRLILAKALTQVATFQHQPRLAMAFGAKRQTFMDRIKRIVGINDAKPMSYGNWAVFVGMIVFVAIGIAYGQDEMAQDTKFSKANKIIDTGKSGEKYDFYFFEKDKKNVGVYKNTKGEIEKILVDGVEISGESFKELEKYAIEFLKNKDAHYARVLDIDGDEMNRLNSQFFYNEMAGDTSTLDEVEKEMHRLGSEMEKYGKEMEKYGKQMEEKYGKQMEKQGLAMEQISRKMQIPQRKMESLSIEMQEVSLASRKLELQYRDSKMPADVEQKLKGLEKKERELENQMEKYQDEMHTIESEMEPFQRKMNSLQQPMDSLERLMQRYHQPMDSLGQIMSAKGKILEKLAKEEEARFKKEVAELAEMLSKDGLIKNKTNFELRLKGEKLLIDLEPQSAAAYQKVWNWIDQKWGSRIRNLKEKDFRIEVRGDNVNISTYGDNGNIYHHMGSFASPPPPPTVPRDASPRTAPSASTYGGTSPTSPIAPVSPSTYIKTPASGLPPKPPKTPRVSH